MAISLRECPYCREEVRSDAVKCRYCQSSLIEAKTKEVDDSVIYILDKGLVKFGKFAAVILVIFFGFGVYVFGFNLEKAADKLSNAREAIDKKIEEMNKKSTEMNQTEKKMQESQDRLVKVEETIRAADERVHKAESRVIEVQQKVDEHLALIEGRSKLSVEIVARMEESWRGKQLSEQVQKVTVPENAEKSRSGNSKFEKSLWKIGAIVKIAFLDGERNLRERVARVASEWTRYANLRFDFVDKVADADIRVSFRKPGSWSFVGTEALLVAKDQPTINFGWLTSATGEDEVRRVVLHEFGHVLGLIEEMNNPNNDIKWNTDVVYKDLAGPPNNWPKRQVDDVILNKSRREDYPNYRSFDLNSVMMEPIAASWTLNGLTVGLNAVLSESDKAFVSQLYPR